MKKGLLKKKLPTSTFLFSVFLTFLFIPRAISFLTKSDYFNGDFAFYYFLTREIVLNHKLPLLGHVVGEIGGFTQGPLWSYLLIIPFVIFDGDPIGGKIFMLITSILIFLTGSSFAWKYLGKIEGIFVAFFLGSSPYLIKWTNLAWPPFIIPLLTIFYFLFLYLFFKEKKLKYFYLSFFSLGLMTHFEIASLGLILPSFIIICGYLIFKKQISLKSLLTSFVIFIGALIFHLSYDLTHNFHTLRGVISVLLGESNSEKYPIILIIQDRLHLIKTDLSAVFSISDYKVLVVIFMFLILGFFFYQKDKKIKKWQKLYLINFLLIISTTFLGLILIPVERASFWWITYLTITYILFSGIILGYMFKKNLVFKLIILLIFLISIFCFAQNTNTLINRYHEYKNLKNEIKIQSPIEYIYQDSRNQSFNVIFLTGGEKIIDYKYMFLQIGQNNNIYFFPSNIDQSFTSGAGIPVYINEIKQFDNLKTGIYYIIISNNSLKNGYALRVLKDNNFGKIISSKTVSQGLEGFTIQKRVFTK